MAGYVKLWTTVYSSREYLSLSGLERGIFLQLIILCKLQRDDGQIVVENYSQLGHLLAVERRTCARVVSKLVGKMLLKVTPPVRENAECARGVSSSMAKLLLTDGKNPDRIIVLEIPKYKFWQDLRTWKNGKITVQESKKSRGRGEVSRGEVSRGEVSTGSGELANVDNSKEKKETTSSKLDDYRKWKTDHQAELVAISETYSKLGGVEWVKSHTQDIERDIILNPVKYEPISGETWANWVKGWLKRSAEAPEAKESLPTSPITAEQEAKHYEQHKDTARSRGGSEPTSIGDVIKKETGG